MKIKSVKGSISIFVLVALLFMSAFLIISFAGNINKSKIVKEQFNILSDIYSHKDGDENAYTRAYTGLRSKNKQTLTAVCENNNTIDLNKNFGGNLINYKIYGNYNMNLKKLPDDYQQVEFIEGNGTQYILTDIIPDTTTGVLLNFELVSSSGDMVMYGSRSTTNGRFWSGQNNSGFYSGWNVTTSVSSRPRLKLKTKNVSKLNYLNDRKAYLNDVELSNSLADDLAANSHNMAIFAGNNMGTIAYYSKIKLYEMQVTRNSTIIADFIPCYKKTDNITGVYDIIGNNFYEDKGTNPFIIGESASGLGNLITDQTSENYGKYEIPISTTNKFEEITKTASIYLDRQLLKIDDAYDYIDFENSRVVRNIGVNENDDYIILNTPTYENITLPELPTNEDYTKIEVLTDITPSRIEVEYEGYTIE